MLQFGTGSLLCTLLCIGLIWITVYAECNACCNKSQSPNCPLQPSVEFLEMSHVFKDSLSPLGISLQLFKTTNWDPAENSGRKCSLKTSNFTHMIATSGAYMIASGTETSKPTIQHQASCICNHPCFARHQKSSCLCLLQVNCFPTFGFSWIVKKHGCSFGGPPMNTVDVWVQTCTVQHM